MDKLSTSLVDTIPTGWYLFIMPRPTKHAPERGDARTRLLEAARDVVRTKGFAATTVDDLCKAADVTKGAFFHHFKSKDALGVAAAEFWTETTGAFFSVAPYHLARDPLDRVLAYIAFRRAMITEDIVEFTCLVGTLAQETHATAPDIRDAAGASIFGHAETLEVDIAAAVQDHGITPEGWDAASLARHFQATIQGAFILAKAGNDPGLAREALDHLDRYVRLLFGCVQSNMSGAIQ
ncbi:TetR/AcrR family transcriptional regulator [Roseobacter sinensis]|uniref:TetR/AcrR family transcriptional regulator n=1 Tax=Roseobacter sinensis TaxID=2931391 RepID=A0ABT3BM26_9RHOB|nr:TetR/AcrR family transcriptional regulator [Roseobacter sp. WL0113]MCV3274418.1 TetR/AcrR family transcriptional regulator [Roseobacter sp. WL0113]